MAPAKTQMDATLLDVLIDGFEKNEVIDGFHWRKLPMPDEDSAIAKFESLTDEARRWKGIPERSEEHDARRLMAWSGMEIRQAGRAVLIRVRAPMFGHWWHDVRTWRGEPTRALFDWISTE